AQTDGCGDCERQPLPGFDRAEAGVLVLQLLQLARIDDNSGGPIILHASPRGDAVTGSRVVPPILPMGVRAGLVQTHGGTALQGNPPRCWAERASRRCAS